MEITRDKTLDALNGPRPKGTSWSKTMNTELRVKSYEVLEELIMDEDKRLFFGNFLFTPNYYPTEGDLVKAKVTFENGYETIDYFKLVKNYKLNHHFTKAVVFVYGLEYFVNPTLYDNSNVKFPSGKSSFGTYEKVDCEFKYPDPQSVLKDLDEEQLEEVNSMFEDVDFIQHIENESDQLKLLLNTPELLIEYTRVKKFLNWLTSVDEEL